MISLKWDIKLESAVDKTVLCFKPKIVMLMLKFSPEQFLIFFLMSSKNFYADLSPQDSTLLHDIVEIGPLPSFSREDEETHYAFYILTRLGLRYECSSSSKIQVCIVIWVSLALCYLLRWIDCYFSIIYIYCPRNFYKWFEVCKAYFPSISWILGYYLVV